MIDLHPILVSLVFLAWAVVAVMLLLHYVRQPTPVAYIISGVLIGPHVLAFITDRSVLEVMGELGLILLLFFVGTEVSLSRFAKNWNVVLFGTLLQVALSLVAIAILGFSLDWPLARIVLIAFVISLSSTAVVLKYLEENGLLASKVGVEVTGVLIMQDLLVIPMLLIISWLGESSTPAPWSLQLMGVILFSGLSWFVLRTSGKRTPTWVRMFKEEKELQLFVGLLACFGFALVAELFHLSYGLGAFVAGVLIAHLGGVRWVRAQLHTFHTFFMALFFISIGMLIDLGFLLDNIILIGGLVLLVLVLNTAITAVTLRLFGRPWGYGLYAGSMLAQIGELSFLLAAVGLSVEAISRDGYQIAVLIISLSLLVSPLWITLMGRPHQFAPQPPRS